MWVQSLGQEDPLEEGMATQPNQSHSSVLAGRVPWTEEPGGLDPWGPTVHGVKRVGHD